MTDRPLAPDWLERTREKLAATPLAPDAEAVGRVMKAADGIARVSGLPEVALGALLRFERGPFGFVLAEPTFGPPITGSLKTEAKQ